jgi:hypothetical protein
MKTKLVSLIVMFIVIASACSPATTASFQAFPEYGSADVAGPEEAAGKYRTPDWYSRPFTFETHEVYRGIGEQLPSGALFGLAQGQAQLPPKQILFWLVNPDISADEAVSMLLSTGSLAFGPTETVEILRTSATQFDGTTDSGSRASISAIGTFVGHVGNSWSSNSAGVKIRFIVLDAPGQTMLIYIEAPEAEFEEFVAKANTVLETVQFSSQE